MDDFVDLVDCINSTEYYGLDLLLYSLFPVYVKIYPFMGLDKELRASATRVDEMNA